MTAFLDKLKELDAGATEAPWAVGSREGDDWDSVVFIPNSPYEICQCFNDPGNTDECSANTALIAFLRNNAAAIGRLVEAAESVVEWTERDTEVVALQIALSALNKEGA